MGKYAGSPQQRQRAFSMERPKPDQSSQMPNSHLQFQGSFKNQKLTVLPNKVDTCSYIAKRGNQLVALPFYTESKVQNSTDRSKNYSYIKSEVKQSFANSNQMHATMQQKPLTKYDPNSQRNRIVQPDYKQYYVNRSVLEFGNRMTQDKKAWTSINRNDFVQQKAASNNLHPGIQAYKTQWTHKNLQK